MARYDRTLLLEQFYIGGANSVRALFCTQYRFRAAILPDGWEITYINHVGGDIRIMANIESLPYDCRLAWAVFLDAGNVWLMRKDETARTVSSP